ncbi:DUF4254 domain-containing protein [Bacteroidetes bacterium endosymbiont of Geopemphigus sp.]|uniref:DUF4254 domain-containing protein n=1 Tax=Bacteroidetes bacterium endosymbiont of Geopemphigus sp. TaxID=2047937 RepID=UPI000CD2B5AD|nr:DUF4254 domain-containing protein [Bacteroidetes bacterium endosymbiont of Geopemphigus sp.]
MEKPTFTQRCWNIFNESLLNYHLHDSIQAPFFSTYTKGSIENLLYKKNWIDTVQWHMEDLIRMPGIKAEEGLSLKRSIDDSNQKRTDLVEKIDDWFVVRYRNVLLDKDAKINTESPAWALDRLSILALKIYHMHEQISRTEVSFTHRKKCREKLQILKEQQEDLCTSIEEFLEDLQNGKKKMKIYRQMKMYNDENLNPVLYKKE